MIPRVDEQSNDKVLSCSHHALRGLVVNMAASSEPPPSAQPLSLDLNALDHTHSALGDTSAPGTSAPSKEWMLGVEKYMSTEDETRRFCDCVLAAVQKILDDTKKEKDK